MQKDRQENGVGHTPFPMLGRVGNRVINLTGRRGGFTPASPPCPGWGMLAFARGRGRGLRPASPPMKDELEIFPKIFGGEEIIDLDPLPTLNLFHPQ